MYSALHRVTKQSKEMYFIKWRDVPYNLSTWENKEDPVNSQIRLVYFFPFVFCCCPEKKLGVYVMFKKRAGVFYGV